MSKRSVMNQTLKDLKGIARAEHVLYSKGNKAEKVCVWCKKSRSLDEFNVNKKTRILNKTA